MFYTKKLTHIEYETQVEEKFHEDIEPKAAL